MKMHIQIILYESVREISRLLESFAMISDFSGYDVTFHFVVHDSHPSAIYRSQLKKWLKKDEFTLDVNRNIGFAAGHNWLFHRYGPMYDGFFMIMNPDTMFFSDFWGKLSWRMTETSSNVGIAEMRQFPKEYPKVYDLETLDVNYASGSAAVVRTNAFRQVKGFDEAFFMYYEDVDLSWRLRGLGYRIMYFPDCRVVHRVGGSSTKDGRIESNTFAVTHNLAGEMYIAEKFQLPHEERRAWIAEKSGVGPSAVRLYAKMRKKINVQNPTSDTSLEKALTLRW
ncbi:MAG: hypothetical protein PHG63_02205 [Candidatus Dojkabacteria bacterium]|nr:hypothetical protein [Candidatus Dojkabacteria bacterium]